MRKTLMATALALALCCTAFAGEMNTPPVMTEPSPSPLQGPSVDVENDAPGGLTQMALDLLTVLPSLL